MTTSASLFRRILQRDKRVLITILMIILGIHLASCTSLETGVWSPGEAITRQDLLQDHKITIRGLLSQTYLYCTEQACMPEKPCCNICGGGVGFQIGWDEIHWVGEGIGCSGNECEVKCEPSGTGKVYTVKGILRLSGGGLDLEVDSYTLEE